MRRPPLRAAAAAVTAATVIALLGVAVSDAPDGPAVPVVTVSESGCGAEWATASDGRAGQLVLRLSDTARDPAEVYLIAPGSGDVYAEVLSLLPGVPRTLSTTLDGGSYALRCVFTDGQVRTSPSRTLSGGTVADAVAGVPPLPDLDLGAPVAAYRSYVTAALPGLLADSRRLDADLAAGDLSRARTDWLPAHLDYERLGAAYGTFDNFDDAINGSASGQPEGTATPSWTGFFRIEYGLWHGQGAAELAPLGNTLVSDIQGLAKAFPGQTTPATDLPLRTHEILENALQFQLTGIQDYGSGTTLDTLYANTQGTQAVLATISSLIQAGDPSLLTQINQGIATVQADLKADGAGPCTIQCATPTSLSALSTAQRQKVDADLSQLLETLSLVPDLLEERTTA